MPSLADAWEWFILIRLLMRIFLHIAPEAESFYSVTTGESFLAQEQRFYTKFHLTTPPDFDISLHTSREFDNAGDCRRIVLDSASLWCEYGFQGFILSRFFF